MIFVRADGNQTIGSGHIMRCLSIACQIREIGEEVLFVLADEGSKALIERYGFSYLILETEYQHMEQELEKFTSLIEEKKPRICVIDSYYVTENYFRELKKYCRIAYVDDMNAFPLEVDIVINYNIYGEEIEYNKAQKTLLGTAYAPLREEFQRKPITVKEKMKHVFLSTGGSDLYFIAGGILEYARQQRAFDEYVFHVVSGVFNPHKEKLYDLMAQYENIVIHENVTQMAELMESCDVAITAGGSTMYELAALGIPTIAFSFVDNQERIVETFAKKRMIALGLHYLKDTSEHKNAFFEELTNKLKELEKWELRSHFHHKMIQAVDGLGALRIAKEL